MEYKGYSGTIHQDNDGHYHGRIIGINELLTYSGMTIDSFESAFRATVDEYIQKKRRKKTILFSILGALIAFVVLLIVTCPDESAHKDRIGTVVKQGIGLSTTSADDELEGLGAFFQLLGGGITDYAINSMLEVNNYFLFSVGTITYQKETKIIVNHAIFLEITSRKFLVRNLAVQAMEKLTTELHSLSEMDRRHVVSILAEIANGYDDFSDMLIYLEFYPNHKILIS